MSAGPETAPRPDPSEPGAEPGGRRAHRERERRRARAGRRLSIVGVLGELLITAGVLVLLFLGWQLWFTELTVGHELRQEATQQTEEWNAQASATPTPPAETPSQTPSSSPDPLPPVASDPPVATAPADGKNFAMLIVPRWGADYYRTIAEGVGVSEVLNKGKLGHYPSTVMPGAVGNFAIAAHRMGHGGSLHHINELQLGDRIYVETAAGWYEYSFRNLEFVHPTGVGVLDAVPQAPEAPASERYITLTSCNPQYTSSERIIAYGLFDRFYPRDTSAPNNGAPAEIAATVNGGA